MTTNTYVLNDRPYSLYTSLEQALQFDPTKNYLFDLSYLGMIQLQGDNSQAFLQGQLTTDVASVQPTQMKPGALCNIKGRILALVDVLQWNGLKLILPEDMVEATLTNLAKTAMFSRIKLSQKPMPHVLGFYCQNPNDLMPSTISLPESLYHVNQTEAICIYTIGPKLHIILLDDFNMDSIKQPFIARNQWKGSLAWHKLQLLNEMYELYPVSRGLFLPHRLELHNTERISFNKGCYLGQEIIARTHYRAKLKHEMKLFIISSAQTLRSGLKLISTDEPSIEVGELVDFCPIGKDKVLIAASVLKDNLPAHCFIEGHDKEVALVPLDD
ncbi:YgfZ/GcvT domain-containing protein [Legionella yabuuchiae]|uniref:CAF17-like 4Fe-4S cluster assembly/insertion protein YgfZ n=1 Tax=Legionella yabuuchiae TaxID=376727 RepID=UPI0010541B6A|nr:folate-binding protein YgfZ [Legionella yabuuchiae]